MEDRNKRINVWIQYSSTNRISHMLLKISCLLHAITYTELIFLKVKAPNYEISGKDRDVVLNKAIFDLKLSYID